MFPVSALADVRCAWLDIKAQGFALHGFLTFLAGDHYFPEYLDEEGLGDLDVWSGDHCAIFVVQSPSAAWISYAQSTAHPWWRLYSNRMAPDGPLAQLMRAHLNEPVLSVDGTNRTFAEVFAPRLNQFQHNGEVAKILRRFGLQPTDHPSLIMFRDLRDRTVWHVDLVDLVGVAKNDLRIALRKWFSGPEFKRLMEDA